MNRKILNFGSLNIDYVYNVDEFVSPGETKLSSNLNMFGGGKGNNQSIGLARAGAKVFHAGCVGKDGQFMVENLQNEGVNTDHIHIRSDIASGHAIIQVNQQGENCILLHGGANQAISVEFIEQVLADFAEGDILLIQNEISNLDKLIKLAGAKGMIITFNPSPMNQKILSYPLEYIDTFIVNENEAQALTKATDSKKMLDHMSKRFPKSKVILTLGSQGVIYRDAQQQIIQPGYKATPIDTTAAGDTFLGYYLASQQKEMPIKEALDLACYAASVTVTRKGATSSIPTLTELNYKENTN